MIRGLVHLVILVVVLAVAGSYLFGYRITFNGGIPVIEPGAAGTSGSGQPGQTDRGPFDPSKARTEGAELGERAAEVGNKAAVYLSEAALTAKIKSKMSLDDHVRASNIHVSTTGHVVTLSGAVANEDEHRRAVDLARDTDGVKSVVDRIRVRR